MYIRLKKDNQTLKQAAEGMSIEVTSHSCLQDSFLGGMSIEVTSHSCLQNSTYVREVQLLQQVNVLLAWRGMFLSNDIWTVCSRAGIAPITVLFIIIIIIIIIITLGFSSMQGIYTYMPETNHVPREHCVATILM
jgi:hypothetical protein